MHLLQQNLCKLISKYCSVSSVKSEIIPSSPCYVLMCWGFLMNYICHSPYICFSIKEYNKREKSLSGPLQMVWLLLSLPALPCLLHTPLNFNFAPNPPGLMAYQHRSGAWSELQDFSFQLLCELAPPPPSPGISFLDISAPLSSVCCFHLHVSSTSLLSIRLSPSLVPCASVVTPVFFFSSRYLTCTALHLITCSFPFLSWLSPAVW